MFKFVIVCACFAAAAAKPGIILSPFTSAITPSVTTYTNQASSIVHPSPIVYSAPWSYAHYIKKRSAQLPITYITPHTYLTSPIAANAYTAPLYHTSPAFTLPLATAHLIKKRSAPLFSSTYFAPTAYSAAASLVPSTYTASAPLISTPYYTSASLLSQPLTYSTHFIKKRSASAPSAYLAPGSFSHQSRIDLNGAPWVSSYSSPFVYSTPVGHFSHAF